MPLKAFRYLHIALVVPFKRKLNGGNTKGFSDVNNDYVENNIKFGIRHCSVYCENVMIIITTRCGLFTVPITLLYNLSIGY